MKTWTKRTELMATVALLTVACLCGPALAQNAAIDKRLSDIAGYEYGKSKAGLYAIDEWLRTTHQNAAAEQAMIRFLRSDAKLAAKQYICEKLSLIGSQAAVPTLADLLSDDDTFDMALFALERIGGSTADAAIARRLDSASPQQQAALVTTLGRLGSARAVAKVAALAKSDNAQVAAAAITALGGIGSDQAAEVLAWTVANTEGPRQVLALDSYLSCADRMAVQGQRRSAAEVYRKLYEGEYPDAIRVAALSGLATARPRTAGQVVLQALQSDNEAIRTSAVSLAQEVGDTATTRALAENLSKLSTKGQVQLLSALAVRGDSAAVPAVIKAAESGQEPVRLAALNTLGRIGDASEVKLLARKAADASGAEQNAAREALYALRGPQVNATIVDLIQETSADVQAELIAAAEARTVETAVPALLKAAESDNPQIKRASYAALAAVASPDDLPALLDLLASSSARGPLEAVIVRVAARNPNADARADAIVKAWNDADNLDVQASLLRILGKTDDPDALTPLRAALDTEQLRDTAVRVLADWPTAAPMDALWQVAKSTDNRLHRILALRGYLRMIGLSDASPSQQVALYERASQMLDDAAGKRMLLSALADNESLASFQMAARYLDDDSVQQEAELAVAKIGQALAGSYPQDIKPTMQKLADGARNDQARQQAARIAAMLNELQSYITCWQVAGPYTGDNLFDREFAPEKQGEQADWKLMPMGLDGARPWVISLDKHLGGDNRVAYLRNQIYSPREQKARLEIGSDDGNKIWLNGELVHANNANRPMSPGQDKADVTLKQGWNPLLMKVTQGGGEWQACLQIVGPDGKPIDGLKCRPAE